jgi:hypothetical protein
MLFTNTGSGAELTKRELTIENRAEVDAHCAYAYLMDDEDVRNTEVLPGFHVKGWIYVPSGHAVTMKMFATPRFYQDFMLRGGYTFHLDML